MDDFEKMLKIKEKVNNVISKSGKEVAFNSLFKKTDIEKTLNVKERRAHETYIVSKLPDDCLEFLKNGKISLNKMVIIRSLSKDNARDACKKILEHKFSNSEISDMVKEYGEDKPFSKRVKQLKEEAERENINFEKASKITNKNFGEFIGKMNNATFEFRGFLDAIKNDIKILDEANLKSQFMEQIFKHALLMQEHWFWLTKFMEDNGYIKHENERYKYKLLNSEKDKVQEAKTFKTEGGEKDKIQDAEIVS